MLTDSIRQQINAFLAEQYPDVYVVSMFMKEANRKALVLRIDTDKGINLDTCAAVSRSLGPWLDESELFDFDHGLEVSSPGATEPLQSRRQYPKNVGRELKVLTSDGSEVLGILEGIDEDAVRIRPRLKRKPVKGRPPKYSEELSVIPFDEIQRATVHI